VLLDEADGLADAVFLPQLLADGFRATAQRFIRDREPDRLGRPFGV